MPGLSFRLCEQHPEIMTLGVMITNFQAWNTTLATLHSVLQHAGGEVAQILVVDDASDAPDQWIGDPMVVVHRNPTNLGYVRSVNVGMSLMKTDLVVVLDCDAQPLTQFAREVRQRFSANPKLAALGFTQTDQSGDLRPSGERVPGVLDFVLGTGLFNRLPEKLREFLLPDPSKWCIHSCCMAVRSASFHTVGGFDERFDFLDADMDFSWRLLEHGLVNEITTQVLCFHPGGGSPQTIGQRVLRHHRNRWLLLRLHRGIRFPALVKGALFVRHLVECFILAFLWLTPARKKLRNKLSTRWTLLKTVAWDYVVCSHRQ